MKFDNTYIELPEQFYKSTKAEEFKSPYLIEVNKDFADRGLGLDFNSLSDEDLALLFSGQDVPEGAAQIALAYAGHQFGHYSPQLGDGRALLLGEILSPEGKRLDIQLKGSGQTPFSRRGDGRSSLGPVIREYIVSEAMYHLGVPTTRALAAVGTGEMVYRERPLPGGIFTRVASSHIRIGSFEYFAASGDITAVKALADYAIHRHYPEIEGEENVYLHFIESVANAQALLVAKWMSFGFIHGVMNTDNMSISGETLDYGPCAFMDNFSFDKVFSSIDTMGRYAYNNQISIAKWNLFRLAESLLPLIHTDLNKAMEVTEKSISGYVHIYEQKWLEQMKPKLGLMSDHENDKDLIQQWLQYLQNEDLDFTLSFRKLSGGIESFKPTTAFKEFYLPWQQRLDMQSATSIEVKSCMNRTNPIYIARNHQVERAIQAAYKGDFSVFKKMNRIFRNPYELQDNCEEYALAPMESERITATFCGT
ncbi:MAG: YdiU family protein [Bdellovibrionaceae bacterium]|nr:YdiU family protein [Pseudobdellovibrionaceae bacterium]